MKIPGLYVLPAFCLGIIGGAFHPFPGRALAILAGVLFLGAAAVWRLLPGRCALALVIALTGWAALGSLSLSVEQHNRPPNLVSRFVATGQLDLTQPLRWRGTLREDPERLPWGVRFDVDLDEIQSSGRSAPVQGGLRASYFGNDLEAAMDLRAGDRIEMLVQARIPRNYEDPGAFDYRGQLARQGIELTASLRSLALVTRIARVRRPLRYTFARIRGQLLNRLDTLFSSAPKQAAVLRAMLLGDRSFVDNDVSEAFQKTSSYHVLVIAGLHVAALAAFVVWCCSRFRLGRLASSVASLAALAAYLGIVQDRPPILRAALMAAAYLLARAFFRRLDILQAAALAALFILFVRPDELADSSFQFSFLAVAAIGGIALPWLDRTAEPLRHALQHVTDVTRDPSFPPRLAQLRLDLRAMSNTVSKKLPTRLNRYAPSLITLPIRGATLLWETFVISAVIQLGLTPLLVDDFHRVGIVGLLANIPTVLLTSLIVPLGFLAVSVSFFSMAVGRVLGRIAGAAVSLLLKVVDWFAASHMASFRVPNLPQWLLIAFFVSLLFLALAVRAHLRLGTLAAAAIVMACALAATIHPFAPHLLPGQLELTVLDVGQGDSLFLAAPDGHTMLIDGGGSPGAPRIGGVQTRFDVGEEVVSPYLWSRGLKHLDVVALTHAHEDHIEGLSAMLQNFRVKELWVGHDVASPAYRQLLQLARMRGTKIVHLERGDSFTWGALRGEVLWPDTTSEVRQATNDDSLVIKVMYGAQALLLTGDIEKPIEHALTAEHAPLAAGFLKVPHHGSATSSTAEFLELVRPSFAAISVGENNPFNHPAPAAIERLRAVGAQVFRTDLDGAITLTTDGKTERVVTFRQTAPTAAARFYDSLER